MTEQNAIVVQQQESAFLAPAATLGQLRERYQLFNKFVQEMLRPDVDFQTLPGTDKPTLIKPGAEKLCTLFGLTPRFDLIDKIEDWTGQNYDGEPFFKYDYRCSLYRGERLVATCDGSANSHESKYRYRQANRKCPQCGKDSILRSKYAPKNDRNAQPGWYCFTKTGGCGAEFSADDKRIVDQQTGRIPNPDIADIVNTLMKMSQKRAFVGATLIATNASEYFTQDIEEMPGFTHDIIDGDFKAVKSNVATMQPNSSDIWDNEEGDGEPKKKVIRNEQHATRPYAPEMLKRGIEKSGEKFVNKDASDEQRKLVAIVFEECFAPNKNSTAMRHSVQNYLYGAQVSLSNAPDGFVLALLDWLKPTQDNGGEYHPAPMAVKEANAVWKQCNLDAGQQEFDGMPSA